VEPRIDKVVFQTRIEGSELFTPCSFWLGHRIVRYGTHLRRLHLRRPEGNELDIEQVSRTKAKAITEPSRKSGKHLKGSGAAGPRVRTRAIHLMAWCEYCGKKLNVQDEYGENLDGNRMVLEIDGSRKRACRRCADRLEMNPDGLGFQESSGAYG